MQLEIVFRLVDNIALLLSLWVIYVLLTGRVRRSNPAVEKIIVGLSVGLIGLGIMVNPLVLVPGLVFDTRSILLSISGLFFGTVPTLIAALITTTYRLLAGGMGALPGVGVIAASTLIGLGARVICRRRGRDIKAYGLYLMGVMVHIAMLSILILALPDEAAREVLYEISLPVLLLYPLATVLLGLLFLLQRTRTEQAQKLAESESRYHLLFETSPDALFVLDSNGRFVDYNSVAVERYGYTPAEIKQMTASDLAAPDLKDEVAAKVREALTSGATFEWWHKRKDGSLIPVEINASPIVLGGDRFVLSSIRDLSYRFFAEQALRDSEERLRVSTELANVAVWEFDFRTNSMSRSVNHDALYGLKWQPIWHYETFLNATHPDDRERSNQIIQASAAPGGPDHYEFDFRVVYADGSIHWLSVVGQVMERDEEGRGLLVRGSLIDITARKQAELALRESEARFASIFRSSPFGINLFRTVDGRSIDVNEAYLKITGYTRDEVVGHTADDLNLFVNPKARNAWMKTLSEVGRVINQDAQIYHKDGEIRDVLAAMEMIRFEDEPVVLVMVADITDRQKAENALRISEERLRLAVRTGKVGLWDYDIASGRVYYSPEWKRQLGFAEDEIVDEVDTWFSRLHPDDRERGQESMDAYMDPQWLSYENEFRLRHKDGSYRWILTQANLIKDTEGAPARIVGTHIDITEIKRTYQELQDSHRRMQNLAQEVVSAQEAERHIIARELHDESGQMITGILIQLGMLEQKMAEDLTSEKAELKEVRQSLQELMENLRRMAHGLRPSALDTLGFETALEHLFADFCERVKLELDYQAEPIPAVEDFKAISLYRLAQEALTNIAKYAQASKVVVNLSYQDSLVQLSIRDDGVGFDPDALVKKGMGLAGMAERLELVSGSLEIDALPGKGTLIRASIPVKEN